MELIICEKPQAAKKVAESLGKPIKKSEDGVPFYLVTHGGKDIIVASAVGHLYSLVEKKSNNFSFPVFDVEWKPLCEVSKIKFSKKYLDTLKQLSKKCNSFTVACDYDIEGEVIGFNIIRYVCRQKDANRMKFSTLTSDELVDSYENKAKHIDWGQANAGETRHKLDWFYGINLSRALTSSIKRAGKFKVMSIGRVQGPTLKLIVDKEKEIQAFVPEPYWQIELLSEKERKKIDSWHEKDKFSDEKEARKIFSIVNGAKEAAIKDVQKTIINQLPPFPFDLTSLQIEAHKTLRIPPKDTLEIAQELYTNSWISYPRTSSQQLPEKIGYKKILGLLKSKYPKEVGIIFKKAILKPNEGKKTDPAHPAIYPTGLMPHGISGWKLKLYDLITRRFLACFGEPAVRETVTIKLDCRKEIFIAKGTLTRVKGWHELYEPYVMLKEEELPAVAVGEVVKVKKIELLAKETQPPKRYTDASIIKSLEKANLGTKATRAAIVDTLLQRNYVHGRPLQATKFGIRTCEILEKYCPKILDQAMTRKFEEDLEEVREGKKKPEKILEAAQKVIVEISDDFKKHLKEVGKELSEANFEVMKEDSKIGKCPKCDGILEVRSGKFGRFIACNKYPDCKVTFSLPSMSLVKGTEQLCEKCKYPIVKIIRGKRMQMVCINPKCPGKNLAEKKETVNEEKKPCPKCGKGHLILRSSIFGQFFGCTNYPNCRYIEKLNHESQKDKSQKPEVFGNLKTKFSKEKK